MYIRRWVKTFPPSRFLDPDLNRRRIPLGAFGVCWVAVLLMGVSAAAQNQTQPSPKARHAPRTLPLGKFYETPEPLPAGKPGELIRAEQAYDYHLSYEASAYRILYHSISAPG